MRGNDAGAIIFRGGDIALFAPYVSLLQRERDSPLLPASPRRRRSPLSGVSDGYEILRAAAAKWYPRGKLFPQRLRPARLFADILYNLNRRALAIYSLRYDVSANASGIAGPLADAKARRHYSIVEAAQIAP